MSAEADVFEMKDMCGDIADHYATGPSMQERVTAVMRQIGVGSNRAYEFLKARARRVDGWEKDRARLAKAKIEEAKHAEHLQWLESEIARHREGGSEFRGPHVDGLEHFLRMARGEGSAMANQTKEGAGE